MKDTNKKENKGYCDKVGSFKCIMNDCNSKTCPLKLKNDNRKYNK